MGFIEFFSWAFFFASLYHTVTLAYVLIRLYAESLRNPRSKVFFACAFGGAYLGYHFFSMTSQFLYSAMLSLSVLGRLCFSLSEISYESANLIGKTAIVTGVAKGSIGYYIAEGLLQKGAHVILIDVLSPKSFKEVEEALAKTTGKRNTETVCMNLVDISSIKAAVQEIKGRHKKIDILHNNAGFGYAELSNDGYPGTWSVHALGPALFTFGLQELLLNSDMNGGPRIVFTTSIASEFLWKPDQLKFELLKKGEKDVVGFDMTYAYCRAKLCQHLTMKGFQRHFQGRGISCAFHPGLVATSIWSGRRVNFLVWSAMKTLFRQPWDGAKVGLFLSNASHQIATAFAGQYFMDYKQRSSSAPSHFLGEEENLISGHWQILVSIAKENSITV